MTKTKKSDVTETTKEVGVVKYDAESIAAVALKVKAEGFVPVAVLHETAAEAWRRNQAILCLNRFRGVFEKMRVRAFIRVREDEEADIDRSAYYSVEKIAEHTGMRAQVIADITGRMKTLASELKMWKLNEAEQAALFAQLREAMAGE